MPTLTRSKTRWILAACVAVSANGCALPGLSPAGAGVRLAAADAVGGCENLGKVTASVVDKVAGIPRHPETVQEDISVTARNSAANMGADTIVPASKVEDGKQTFNVYRCLRR
ncbi:MAG: DUF4156 domain-containing protein [Betaproteobacteria bacterium]|nr:DUF4156 domain-containing protein [Betaproteobacteria bacterium]MDH5221783.1 DUF4156 domain-containing protein [Betaproteobacteria bacterium]MDH5351490.1 DUF4156 domain-containing protein [Betaproteobacteria bacterium]